ncbi:hypothetical protein HF885_01295 [Olsenella umbonata]|uniref:Uncharacterized protein n=1 Tax=Parafannyhessea umbonata TaxID=604330 RepID=A0A7X9T969_9ACTN|nr:hypothetical protein [Parafannyhessea umbonata]NMF25080.1 hypothetical protein [Parafannyhessea umbonata]
MKPGHVGIVDAANNAVATVRGAASTLIAFSCSGQELDDDAIGLLYDALNRAADSMERVAESIKSEDEGEEK